MDPGVDLTHWNKLLSPKLAQQYTTMAVIRQCGGGGGAVGVAEVVREVERRGATNRSNLHAQGASGCIGEIGSGDAPVVTVISDEAHGPAT